MLKIKIVKIKDSATTPSYAHFGDAAMDFYSSEDVVIARGARVKVPTGIKMEIPENYVGLIWDKSGLSMNYGLKTLGGVVDSGYRGEVMVGIINLSDKDFELKAGEKIAQMIIQKKEEVEVEEVKELEDSSRGEDGFGSTGK